MDELMKKDLGLAILLWMRLHNQYDGGDPTNHTIDAGIRAIQMAKAVGVFNEFWELMNKLPVMKIKVAELDTRVEIGKNKKGKAIIGWRTTIIEVKDGAINTP